MESNTGREFQRAMHRCGDKDNLAKAKRKQGSIYEWGRKKGTPRVSQ